MQNITHTPCVPFAFKDFYDPPHLCPSCLRLSQYRFVFYVTFMIIIILGFVGFRYRYTFPLFRLPFILFAKRKCSIIYDWS